MVLLLHLFRGTSHSPRYFIPSGNEFCMNLNFDRIPLSHHVNWLTHNIQGAAIKEPLGNAVWVEQHLIKIPPPLPLPNGSCTFLDSEVYCCWISQCHSLSDVERFIYISKGIVWSANSHIAGLWPFLQHEHYFQANKTPWHFVFTFKLQSLFSMVAWPGVCGTPNPFHFGI